MNRLRFHLGRAALLALSLGAASLFAAPQGELTRRGAAPLAGVFQGVSESGAVRWLPADGEQILEIPGEEVEVLRLAGDSRAATGALWVSLVGGDRLALSDPGGDAAALTGAHPALGAVRLPWHRVTALESLTLGPFERVSESDRERVELLDARDRRQAITGEVLDIRDGTVRVLTGNRIRQFPLEGAGDRFVGARRRVRAVTIAEQPGLHARVVLDDGSLLSGRLRSADAATLRLSHAWIGDLALPVEAAREARFHYGGMRWAGALEALEFRWTSPFAGAQGPFPAWRLETDRALDGAPLVLAGRHYPRGLAMHAPARLRYRIDGRYDQFAALLGVDARGGLHGSVVFSVFADQEESPRYRSGVITAKSPPEAIAVAVENVLEVTLEVDATPDGDRGDWALWADARFLVLPRKQEK